jgi:membrane fusion protein (multidrug efflux system)
VTTPRTVRMASATLLLTAAVGSIVVMNRSESSAAIQTTNDAYVQADFTTVAPQVSGTVSSVLVQNGQAVRAGDLLAVVDDRQFAVAVAAADARVASARAAVAALQARLVHQSTTIRQSQAAVAGDEAALELAMKDLVRYRNLARDGAGTVQAQQQAQAQVGIHRASLQKNQAGVLAARQQVAILEADLENRRAVLAEADSALSAARLKLSFTRITAPISGVIGHQSIRIGAYIAVGQPLLAIVPLDDVYVTAHFRETQLARVRVGQPVEIAVDALPGEILAGAVESLGPASGVTYSAIAPHNATGNFTKIVQRLPVRIRIDPGQAAASRLRVGMSVVPSIHVDGPAKKELREVLGLRARLSRSAPLGCVTDRAATGCSAFLQLPDFFGIRHLPAKEGRWGG